MCMMAYSSRIWIGLSVAFGCLLLLSIAAELYYLLWWKRKITNSEVDEKVRECIAVTGGNLIGNGHGEDLEKGFVLKSLGEESIEAELMRLHNLAGPPRFLFTIKEETKDDLDSEDGKSKSSRKNSRTKSLSDLMLVIESPLASPCLKASLDSPHQQGFNPLFESASEAELNRLRSSPPPKFKFLREAEEKLQKKLIEEAKRNASMASVTDGIEGSFMNFLQQYPSSTNQVLPLDSSPW